MSAVSSALSESTLSRVLGYKLKAESFRNNSPNLQQYVAVFGEANTANQSTLTTAPFEFTNATEVGNKYGFGSPLHQLARILRPQNANLLAGVKTVIYPQISDVGATATVITKSLTVATTVTENARHTIIINGRGVLESGNYSYDVVKGQSAADVQDTIVDTISNVLGCPVTAAEATADVAFTTKWAGATSAELKIEFDTNGKDAGIVYAEASKVAGSGSVDITPSLNLIGETWVTMLLNPYGSSEFDELEAFNGIPDKDNPTGRYLTTTFKPLCAFFGTTESTKAGVLAITDVTARKSQVTNVHCPAPNSKGFTWEAAANMIASTALLSNDKPHLGNGGRQYFDMPTPENEDIGEFADYSTRDELAKKGSSTVTLKAGKYQIEDLETTYHPDGEFPPKYRKFRDLNVNWNIGFGWLIIMADSIQDKTIVLDGQPVRVSDTISPAAVKQLIFSFSDDLQNRALINDAKFTQDSAIVAINDVNAARLDINYKTKITSTADQVSSDVSWDFTYTS